MTKLSSMKKGIAYTLLMIFVLFTTISIVIGYMYTHSEEQAFESLRQETVKFKSNINLQMMSDRETLRSIANLVADHHNDAAGYEEVCKNFESFGLCENIGILIPGDILVTKHGPVNVKRYLSFEEEKLRGEYISGRVVDVTNETRHVIRSSVPIFSPDGQVKAVMYGTINIERFAGHYAKLASSDNSYLCILEGRTGNFIIDTKKDLNPDGNITNLASVNYKEGFSYKKMIDDITSGESGYTSFVAKNSDEYLYVRYGSLDFEDWRIMLAQSQTVVFSGTQSTMRFLTLTSFIICGIILIYILGVMFTNRRIFRINSYASEIRRSLLEINQRSESITDALRNIVWFAKSRSAFIVDAHGEEHHYIVPTMEKEILNPKEIEYFNNKLLIYAAKHRNSVGADIYNSEIKLGPMLRSEMPDFYNFMKTHGIDSVRYSVVINNNSNIYVLGVLNPANKNVSELLRKIAVCFSISLYNQNHLKKTKYMALTDSLTGLENRMAFGEYIKSIKLGKTDYACIYIDVNELHFYNNKYGHAAGDQMLIFIANTLKDTFKESKVFRMGGDEFLIFCDGLTLDDVEGRISDAKREIEEMKYHISVGIRYGAVITTVEEMVNDAEKIMYDDKAKYYQDKELSKVKGLTKRETIAYESGVQAIDACLSVMSLRYYAIYCMSFDKDSCVRIMAPSYFGNMNEEDYSFSSNIRRYIFEFVKPEYHRAILSFLDYDMIKKQLSEGNIPRLTYERIDEEKVLLKVYPIDEKGENLDSLWVFEKQEM